jgi:hypothetical protein
MTTLTNEFHNTEITIRANEGEQVSKATRRKVQKALCGISDCQCSGYDGTRGSMYRLQEVDGRGRIEVVKR